MPNTTTAADTLRFLTDEALKVIASFTPATPSDLRQEWAARLADLINQAHELALREDEERWADAQLDGYREDDAAAVRDLALRVRRNYRLSREPGRELMSRYSRWCSNAARELREEHGFEVDNLYGVWTIETVRSGDDYC